MTRYRLPRHARHSDLFLAYEPRVKCSITSTKIDTLCKSIGVSLDTIRRVIEVYENGQPQEVTYLESGGNRTPHENPEVTGIADVTDAQTCDTSPADSTVQLLINDTGEIVSIKVLDKPPPKGITREEKHAHKAVMVDNITALHHEGKAPSDIAAFLGIPPAFVSAVIAGEDF